MVMNHEVIDTYLHMTHHYKLINSAKSIVNTSCPKSYLLRNKQNASSPSTRYSTPTLLSKNDLLPSRANSHCGFGHRNIKIHNCLQNDFPPRSSSSVPLQKNTKRNCTTKNFLKANKIFSNHLVHSKSKTALSNTNTSSSRISRDSSKYSDVKHMSHERPKSIKIPIPTPRKKFTLNKTVVSDYEYVQFSLRITEDIIRNDLYDSNDMQRVFQSHLEANRGRLDMTKMLEQIDHLCKELSVTENEKSENKSTELTLGHNSKVLLDEIANRQYEITNEEIRNLSGRELQNIITGILDNDIKDTSSGYNNTSTSVVYLKEVPISFDTDHFLDLSKKDIESELLIKAYSKERITSDESKLYEIDVKNSEVNSKVIFTKPSDNELTQLVPFVSQHDSEIYDYKASKETSNNSYTSISKQNAILDIDIPKIENKTILISSDEVDTSVNISENKNKKELTIINLQVSQLHDDLLEINKNLTQGFHNLKETIVMENPEKEISISNFNKQIEINNVPSTSTCGNFFHMNSVLPNAYNTNFDEIKNEVCRKKNENTQTPFSKEIKQFLDKLPEATNAKIHNKDVINYVGITEKAEIDNITQTFEQIKIYEPIYTEYENKSETFESTQRSENASEIQPNFISTVNNMILDKMNDLFEPVYCKDINPVPNIFLDDYYKYETNNEEDKYINNKYKLQKFSHPRNLEDLYKHVPSSQKSSELSLSEGQLIVNLKPKKQDQDILKVLEKYERKTYDHTSINKYKLNKFEQKCELELPMHNIQFYNSSTSLVNSPNSFRVSGYLRESLLSDGEIKYSSDSDDYKTDSSNNSSKV